MVGDDGGREGPEDEGGVGGQEAIAEQPAADIGVFRLFARGGTASAQLGLHQPVTRKRICFSQPANESAHPRFESGCAHRVADAAHRAAT